eukprot:g3590.t1
MEGLTSNEEEWDAKVRADFQAGPPDGENLFDFEEYDQWAATSYFDKFKHHVLKELIPVGSDQRFPGWTVFAGPDDDVPSEKRAKRHDRRSLLRVLRQVWAYMSQVIKKPKRASFPGNASDQEEQDEGEVEQLNVPVCKHCDMKRPCDEQGVPVKKSVNKGVTLCAKDGCSNQLQLQDRFCAKCGAVAPKNLLEAAAGLGPRVWDDHAPLDPNWDRNWRKTPLARNDVLWYYGSVKTDPSKPDGLVAMYCIVLAAPDESYKNYASTYDVPWYKCLVEVCDMRVSKELAVDFRVRGITPLPEMSRAFNGCKKAKKKLAVYQISIPKLIEAWKDKTRVIMIFNIATYRRGVTSYIHTEQPVEKYIGKTVIGLTTTRMRKPPQLSRLSAWDKGKMWLLPYVPGWEFTYFVEYISPVANTDLHVVQFLGNPGFACQPTLKQPPVLSRAFTSRVDFRENKPVVLFVSNREACQAYTAEIPGDLLRKNNAGFRGWGTTPQLRWKLKTVNQRQLGKSSTFIGNIKSKTKFNIKLSKSSDLL